MNTDDLGQPSVLDERQDFAPVSGPVRTLALFLGIILLCAVTFAVGYRLGKRASGEGAAVVAGPVAGVSSIPKPSADSSSTPMPTPIPAAAVDTPPAAAVPATSASPAPDSASQSAAASTATPAPTSPPMAAPAATAGSFAVQVAAVSKQEDADALVAALRQKNYPVFVLSNQLGDKLFHVQVGPFATLEQAEGARTRLAGDGYNPIVKK